MATMDTQQHLSPVLAELADVLDGVSDTTAPTPCTEFDVAALRAHVVGWLGAFADGFTDASGSCSDPESHLVRGTGGDQVRAIAARLDDALTAGAGGRPLSIGSSAMPGDMALSMILWEYQMHGWDLARAVGRPWNPDEDGVLASLQFAPMMLTPDFQGVGKPFAPRIDIDAAAPAIDRLAALSGRDPAWSRA